MTQTLYTSFLLTCTGRRTYCDVYITGGNRCDARWSSHFSGTIKRQQSTRIQLFRERLSEKKCARDNAERWYGIWSIPLFLTLKLSKLLLLISFSSCKHSSGLFVPFFQILLTNSELKTTQIPFGIVAWTFSHNLSRNSCIRPQIHSVRMVRFFFVFLIIGCSW